MLIPPIQSPTLSIVPPEILSRTQWEAKAPIQPFKTHEISRITLHHAGVATSRARPILDKLKGLQAWSQREDKLEGGRSKPAWPDIPYHFYVFWDGTVAECRPWKIVGDTNTEYDPSGHLLICLEGNFETEEPTGAQIHATNRLVQSLALQFRVPPNRIESHLDHSKQTSCPGKNFYPEIAKLRWRWELRLRACGLDWTQWK
jgi:hypothetical protein